VRLRTSAATVVLASGLLTAGVATAAPLSANETLSNKLHKLRVCESGDRYHVNTGNGYYGAYQFNRGTWHSLGMHGRPDKAKATHQDKAAKKLHAKSGWAPWPSCARKEHL
jgi:hypothetical protein